MFPELEYAEDMKTSGESKELYPTGRLPVYSILWSIGNPVKSTAPCHWPESFLCLHFSMSVFCLCWCFCLHLSFTQSSFRFPSCFLIPTHSFSRSPMHLDSLASTKLWTALLLIHQVVCQFHLF